MGENQSGVKGRSRDQHLLKTGERKRLLSIFCEVILVTMADLRPELPVSDVPTWRRRWSHKVLSGRFVSILADKPPSLASQPRTWIREPAFQ